MTACTSCSETGTKRGAAGEKKLECVCSRGGVMCNNGIVTRPRDNGDDGIGTDGLGGE